jgi:uncharacterized protein
MTAVLRLAVVIGLALAPVAAADARVPARTLAPSKVAYVGRVTDAADILVASQRISLDRDLTRIQARTKAQIVVATVPTLGGRDIAGYARDLGNRWGIGDDRRDDGIVILLAPNEQLVRIAVGEGLDKILTDEVCQQIINEVMLPEFREGRLYEGLTSGIAALNARL